MKFFKGPFLAVITMAAAMLSPMVWAANEISRLVPFQGRLHTGDNKVVSDGVYNLTFNIYDTPTGGASLWTEDHDQVSVIHGYVNVLLGALNPLDKDGYTNGYDNGNTKVNFSQQKYLGISINGGAEMFPRSQLVPSFHAVTADHAHHAHQADNADKLGNVDANFYATKSYVDDEDAKGEADITTLKGYFTNGVAKNAADANTLDGHDSTHFTNASNLNAGSVNVSLLPNASHTAKGIAKTSRLDTGEDGYYWDKNTGFMIQWGRVTTTSYQVSDTYTTTFDSVYNASATHQESGIEYHYALHIQSFNTSGISIRSQRPDQAGATIYWQVIGYKNPN